VPKEIENLKNLRTIQLQHGVSTFDVTIFYSPYNIYILDYGKKT